MASRKLIGLFFSVAIQHCYSMEADYCPDVKALESFNIFAALGPWYVVQYYSSAEEAMTYHCMRTEFALSNGNMDMKMRLTYKYAADPNEEKQTGNITWQIPDPMRPGHWRHTEDHYKGVYNTDVLDTDHSSWMILLHCSDPDSEKKFLSTFILSRTPYLDKKTTEYLREKVGAFAVNLDYLFPVNQTFCFGENNYPHPDPEPAKPSLANKGNKDDQYELISDQGGSNAEVPEEQEEDEDNGEEGEDANANEDEDLSNNEMQISPE